MTIVSCPGTASNSPRRCSTPRPVPIPVIIRIETRAGHGAGKPTWMLVEDWANQWAFLTKALGMPGGS